MPPELRKEFRVLPQETRDALVELQFGAEDDEEDSEEDDPVGVVIAMDEDDDDVVAKPPKPTAAMAPARDV